MQQFRRFGVPVERADIPRVEGASEVYSEYFPILKEDIRRGQAPVLVDILNCLHGCNVGPATTHHLTRYQIDRAMDKRKKAQIEKQGQQKKGLFSKGKEPFDEPTREEAERIWQSLHKPTEEERWINCQCCGYGVCEEMMRAIYAERNHQRLH
ncbi:hypothetical protein GTO89_10090 [Heliobacterium gestii]|uniref:Uncharacterized protein n=1 Tax=Heliomicrobium gestii TaxID=2699 RepID=A0A845LEP8_HELGE|nr:hypothetical protein [Heliomicrobium gestii]MBM7868192.1 hypothetical protein [Heliomicrobium gestii]MZP43390.1 hypothetical protein [Heliomicrobium gestii]